MAPSLLGVIELCGRLLDTDAQEDHLDVLVEGAMEILRVDSGYFVREVDDRLVFYRRWNSPTGKSEPVSRAIVSDAMKSPRAILVANASLDSRYALRESVKGNDLRSVLAARIDTEDPVALYLESSSRQLADEHLDLFQRIVDFSSSILRRSAARLQNAQSQELFERFDFHGIVARDPLMHRVLDIASKVAVAEYPVLIQGPSGSGKELIARAIHRNSKRHNQPLVVINCGAIAPTLLESELFGHAAGAFTGATESTLGFVRSADGGTLLLDEIGDLSLETQVKLLRTLQFGEVQPLGTPQPVTVNVRFLASTHRRLSDEVAKGTFREDLFQRLNTLLVEVPALNDRPADIVPLFLHFLDRAARDLDTSAPILGPAAERLLMSHPWTGNVRELENEAKRVVVMHGSQLIEPECFSFSTSSSSGTPQSPNDMQRSAEGEDGEEPRCAPQSLEESERALLLQHLKATGGNRSAAARALGISREGLRQKLMRLGIH